MSVKYSQILKVQRGPSLVALFFLSLSSATPASVTGYVGASLTLTPSASATLTGYYAVGSVGFSWIYSEKWTHQFGYDFGLDVLGSDATSYSTLSLTTTLKLTELIRPRFSAQNTISNDFTFYGLKLKAAPRLKYSDALRMDPGILSYFDSTGSNALGGYIDVEITLSEAWSLQGSGQLMANLSSSSTQNTQYSVGGGITFDGIAGASIYASYNYSLGIASTPVTGGAAKGGGGNRPVAFSPFAGKSGKNKITSFAGTSSATSSIMGGVLLFF